MNLKFVFEVPHPLLVYFCIILYNHIEGYVLFGSICENINAYTSAKTWNDN